MRELLANLPPLSRIAILDILLVAFLIYELLAWQQPGATLRWWLGYGPGAVVAIANLRQVQSASLSDTATRRSILIAVIALIVYAGASVFAVSAM